MSRAGKSKLLTFCPSCGEEVGVWDTAFNRTRMDKIVKTARHRHDGKWCVGSLMQITENVTWPNPNAAVGS